MGTLVTLLGLWFLRRESGSSSSMFLKVLCFVHMPGAWGGGGGVGEDGKLPGLPGQVRLLVLEVGGMLGLFPRCLSSSEARVSSARTLHLPLSSKTSNLKGTLRPLGELCDSC